MAWTVCEICGTKTNGFRATRDHERTHPGLLERRAVADAEEGVRVIETRIKQFGALYKRADWDILWAQKRLAEAQANLAAVQPQAKGG